MDKNSLWKSELVNYLTGQANPAKEQDEQGNLSIFIVFYTVC